MTVDHQERSTWRSGVRSAMHAASQLPGRGPLLWVMSLHLQSDYDDMFWKKPVLFPAPISNQHICTCPLVHTPAL